MSYGVSLSDSAGSIYAVKYVLHTPTKQRAIAWPSTTLFIAYTFADLLKYVTFVFQAMKM